MAQIYSQFKAFRGLFGASFKSLLRNPSLVLFNIIFPLVLIYGMRYIPSPLPKTGVIHWISPSSPEPQFWQSLKERKFISVQRDSAESQEQADALLDWNSEQKAYILTYKNPELKMQNLLYDAVFLTDRRYLGQNHPIIQNYALYSPGLLKHYRDIQILPIIAFVIFTASIFGVAFTFFHLRQDNVFKLIFATPIHKLNIIFAELFSRFLFIFSSAALVLILGCGIIGDANLWLNIGNFVKVLGIIIVGIWAFMPYGFLISIFAKSMPSVPIIGNIFLAPQLLLSGLFVSINAFPYYLQKLASILPFSCFYEALIGIDNELNIYFPLLVLIVYGILGYFLSFRFFRWN